MKHDNEILNFLKEEVNLNQSGLEKAKGTYNQIKREIESKYGDRLIDIQLQGSYATDTIIKPGPDKKDEYDVDILVIIKDDKNLPDDAVGVLKETEEFINNENRTIQRKNKCVSINYAGDFHMDIVPCVKRMDQVDRYDICNRKEDKFEISDGGKYADWFKELDETHKGSISKCVKLIKHIRDHKNTFSCPSIVLTTLFGKAALSDNAAELSPTKTGITEYFVILLNTASEILNSSNILWNPVLPDENLLQNVDNIEIENCRKHIAKLARKVREAHDADNREESLQQFRAIFGDKFGNNNTNRNDNKKKSSSSIPHTTLAVGAAPQLWAEDDNTPVVYFKDSINFDEAVKYLANRYGSENVRVDGVTTVIIDPIEFLFDYKNEKERKTESLICKYSIKVVFDGKRVPKVYGLGENIPRKADRHINNDGSFCLELPEMIYKEMNGVFDISVFMELFVESFLFYQQYVDIMGKAPWETRQHGNRAYNTAIINKDLKSSELSKDALKTMRGNKR